MRRAPEAWSRLLSLVAEAAQVSLPSAAAWPVAREGFRHGLRVLLESIPEDQPPVVLLCAGVQHLSLEVLQDVGGVWSAWVASLGRQTPVRIVLAMEGGAPPGLHAAWRTVELPDYGPEEALRFLVSRLGCRDVDALRVVAERVGGLPVALHSVVKLGGLLDPRQSALPRELLHEVAPAMLEAKTIVCSDERLAERLERLGRGAASASAEVDAALVRAGLVRLVGPPWARMAELRSPMFAGLEETLE